MNTRDMIKRFNLAFKRPVNATLTPLSVTERELMCKLLLEETMEFIEACGCGVHAKDTLNFTGDNFVVEHIEGRLQDPVEMADALGDVNVVIHFNAHWMGINLDTVTREIHDSNMSKLGDDGEPIINRCKYEDADSNPSACHINDGVCINPEHFIDPNRPLGKILKGPNYYAPDIAWAIGWNGGIEVGAKL